MGLQVVCAPTEEEARFIASSRSISKVLSTLRLTTDGMLPPEEAVDWLLPDEAREYMERSTKSYIQGDPDQVREGVLAAAERYQTGDLSIVTNCYYFEHRVRSFELVAEAFLADRPTPASENSTSAADA